MRNNSKKTTIDLPTPVKIKQANKIYCPICLELIIENETNCSYCGWKVKKERLLESWPFIHQMRANIRKAMPPFLKEDEISIPF